MKAVFSNSNKKIKMSLHQQLHPVHRALRKPPQQYFKEMDEIYNSKYPLLPLPISDCNNSNPQGTALPTWSLSCKVPRTPFKHKQVKDTEIKSNILRTDKTCTARALGYVSAAGATSVCSICQLASLIPSLWMQWGCCTTSWWSGCFLWRESHNAACLIPQASPACACCLRWGRMSKVTGKANTVFTWSEDFFSNYGEKSVIVWGLSFPPLIKKFRNVVRVSFCKLRLSKSSCERCSLICSAEGGLVWLLEKKVNLSHALKNEPGQIPKNCESILTTNC